MPADQNTFGVAVPCAPQPIDASSCVSLPMTHAVPASRSTEAGDVCTPPSTNTFSLADTLYCNVIAPSADVERSPIARPMFGLIDQRSLRSTSAARRKSPDHTPPFSKTLPITPSDGWSRKWYFAPIDTGCHEDPSPRPCCQTSDST